MGSFYSCEFPIGDQGYFLDEYWCDSYDLWSYFILEFVSYQFSVIHSRASVCGRAIPALDSCHLFVFRSFVPCSNLAVYDVVVAWEFINSLGDQLEYSYWSYLLTCGDVAALSHLVLFDPNMGYLHENCPWPLLLGSGIYAEAIVFREQLAAGGHNVSLWSIIWVLDVSQAGLKFSRNRYWSSFVL